MTGSAPTVRREIPVWRVLPLVLVAALLAAGVAGSLALCDGELVYTLDDAYIHLALSERIAEGHYGLNPSEPAAPSSSILWPLLLAPLADTPLHAWMPMILNAAAVLGAVGLLVDVLRRVGLGTDRRGRILSAVVAFALPLALNWVGVALTGMEHGLQLLAALGVVRGLVVLDDEDRLSRLGAACLVVGPLVRYELAAVTLGGLVHLGLRRRVRTAAALGAAALLPLGGFSAFLAWLGLPLLPAPVLVKSHVVHGVAEGGLAGAVGGRLARSVAEPGFWLLLAAAVGMLFALRHPSRRPLAAFGLVVAGAHLAAGRYDAFGRYELYALAASALVLLRLHGETLVRLARSVPVAAVVGAPLLLAIAIGWSYAPRTVWSPLAAANIHAQQGQMHRFATDFHDGPAAVNDLGRVAYDNPHRVLDVWGLGSERARRLRMSGRTDWLAELVRPDEIPLAMLYASWFGGYVPDAWVPLARLRLRGPLLSAAKRTVTFYATAPRHAAELRQALERFAPTLPRGASLELLRPERGRRGAP